MPQTPAYVLLIAFRVLRSKRDQICPYLEERWEGFPAIYPGNVVYTLVATVHRCIVLFGFIQTMTFVFTRQSAHWLVGRQSIPPFTY